MLFWIFMLLNSVALLHPAVKLYNLRNNTKWEHSRNHATVRIWSILDDPCVQNLHFRFLAE